MKQARLGQTALEYLLLLAIVGVVVMLMFKSHGGLPQMQQASNQYFDSVQRVIYGEDPKPIDGGWCGIDGRPLFKNGVKRTDERCPKNIACGQFTISRRCECPSPAFGGKHCMDDDIMNDYAYFDIQKDCPQLKVEQCKDCDANTNYCNAPEPTKCNDYTTGRMVCSGDACQKGYPCDTKATCTGLKPTGGKDCPGVNSGAPAPIPWKMVAGAEACLNQDHGGACTLYCDAKEGKMIDEKGNCVAITCLGVKPLYTQACPNRDNPLLSPELWDVVDKCDEDSNCELTCLPTAQYQELADFESTCVAYKCIGIEPQGTRCPNTTEDIVGSDEQWTTTTKCSNKCQVLVCTDGIKSNGLECK